MRRILAPALAAIALGGCAGLIPERLHLLPPAPQPAAADEALAREIVALNPLALPEYAQDRRIASLAPDGAVALADGELWADPLARSGAIVLARALEARTGAAVLLDPLPLEAAPTLRVEAVIDRFVGGPGEGVTLSGVYRVSDLRRNGLAIHRSFEVVGAAEGEGYEALAAAHSAALGRLADDMAAALTDRFAGS